MKKFFGEFKKFITRGNVLDMAVGIIVGGAFTAIVTALNKSILTPFIGALFGGKDIKGLMVPLWNAEQVLDESGTAVLDQYGNKLYTSAIYYGEFIQAIIDFLMIAFVLFVIVKAFNKVRELGEKARDSLIKKEEVMEEPKPIEVKQEPTETEKLLMEIRDLLAENKK